MTRLMVTRDLIRLQIRQIKTGSGSKQPKVVTKVAISNEDFQDPDEQTVRVNEGKVLLQQNHPVASSLPSKQPGSYPRIPKIPHKPGVKISRKEDLDKMIESWQRQLPHDEDPELYDPELKSVQEKKRKTMLEPVDHLGRKLFSNEFIIKLQKKYDYSLDGIRRMLERRSVMRHRNDQAFNSMRHGILGPDLAAAHFICHRLGRVKFCGHAEWFTFADMDKLPCRYEENWLVEKIDATAVKTMWEGLDNMVNLFHLEELNLSSTPYIDVWATNKLCRMYRFSTKLAKVNVSNCVNFCENSLTNMHRIPSLKEIMITGTRAADYKFLNLIVLQLQQIRTDIKVIV